MELMTIFALATKTEGELRVMFRRAAGVAAQSDPRSHERRIALATMENILIALQSLAAR